MTARFAVEEEARYLEGSGYESHATARGKILCAKETEYTGDTVILGLERFLGISNITMQGVVRVLR